MQRSMRKSMPEKSRKREDKAPKMESKNVIFYSFFRKGDFMKMMLFPQEFVGSTGRRSIEFQIKSDQTKGSVLETTENNLIKNLKYEVTLDQDNQYIITSNLSEITYENNIEVVKMQTVKAIFKDKTNMKIRKIFFNMC